MEHFIPNFNNENAFPLKKLSSTELVSQIHSKSLRANQFETYMQWSPMNTIQVLVTESATPPTRTASTATTTSCATENLRTS